MTGRERDRLAVLGQDVQVSFLVVPAGGILVITASYSQRRISYNSKFLFSSSQPVPRLACF